MKEVQEGFGVQRDELCNPLFTHGVRRIHRGHLD